MPQPKKGPRLGSGPAHQRLMLRNLAQSLFTHERIQTTEAKAKMLRPYAERLITKAKKGSIHDRRQVLSQISDREVVHKLFDEIGPRFASRNGGYTRVLKVGPRNGDGAPMALIELVESGTARTVSEDEGARRRLRRPRRRTATETTSASSAAPERSDELETVEGATEVEGEQVAAADEVPVAEESGPDDVDES